jgi:hypothetical protein
VNNILEISTSMANAGMQLAQEVIECADKVNYPSRTILDNSIINKPAAAGVTKLKIYDDKNVQANLQIPRKVISEEEKFDKHLEKVLSIVMHHEEVQEIATLLKKIHRQRLGITRQKEILGDG